MTPVLAGFTDELVKTAGALSGVGKFIMNHKMLTLGGAAVLGLSGYQAMQAYTQGREVGQAPQYLSATPENPSPAFYANFHEGLPHPKSPSEVNALSENLKDESLLRR